VPICGFFGLLIVHRPVCVIRTGRHRADHGLDESDLSLGQPLSFIELLVGPFVIQGNIWDKCIDLLRSINLPKETLPIYSRDLGMWPCRRSRVPLETDQESGSPGKDEPDRLTALVLGSVFEDAGIEITFEQSVEPVPTLPDIVLQYINTVD
jgi:hypothetical protein